jgi:hypothetical protein
MSKKTTLKAISLGYRPVGSQSSVAYTPLMGVLKGLTIGQDEPDSTEIEAEFFDAPFDILYEGNPVTFNFELANYDLSELPAIFGGEYDATHDTYEAAPSAYTSEHEWKLTFQRGNNALVIYKGLTVGTVKKDEDGALNYAVTISSLVYNDGTDDHMYKIVGGSTAKFDAVVTPSGNPKSQGYFESDGTNYRLTWDTQVVEGKTYYTKA